MKDDKKTKYKNEAIEGDEQSQTNSGTSDLQSDGKTDKTSAENNSTDGASDKGTANKDGKDAAPKIDGATGEEKKTEGEEKIKGRGRHKLDCDCEKCKAKKENKEEPKGEDKTDDTKKDASDLSAYKTAKAQTDTTKKAVSNKVDLTEFISGALFLIAIDAVMPSLILNIFSWVNRKYKGVDAKLLRLTPEEQTRLEPLAEAVVKLIFGSCNPIVAMAVTMGLIYAGKFMMLDEKDFKPVPPKKGEKKK